VEVEIEELQAAMATANDATEKAATATTTAEAAARDAAQEKTVLEVKVAELEQDLFTSRSDLRMVNWQFSEVTNRLQVVSDEATWLREDNSKLSQDIDSEA
jgi:uncharacterized phage infection (PIP) family protein YhgE